MSIVKVLGDVVRHGNCIRQKINVIKQKFTFYIKTNIKRTKMFKKVQKTEVFLCKFSRLFNS